MKMIKTTFLTLTLVCVASMANAQTSTQVKPARASQNVTATQQQANQEFAIETSKLKQAFKGGTIPADFPKYNKDADKKQNKKDGIAYLVGHQDLLTEEAIAKLKEKGLI